MKNPKIGKSESKRIDQSVSRLLTDLKGVEPPLDLSQVRGQLKLNVDYYSGSDPSHLSQLVHSLIIAGNNVKTGKNWLGKLIKKFGIRGLLFWHDNRILIDQDLHKIKYRWTEAHETGHKLCGWHKHYLLGDTKNELSPSCQHKIEAEANYAAGQLLFMQGRFIDEAMSIPASIQSIKTLKQIFGNSNASTLYRMVEEYRGPEALVGVVCGHPHRPADDFDPDEPCRYTVQSKKFRGQFSTVSEQQIFQIIAGYCNNKSGGPLGNETFALQDDNGQTHEFVFESFCYRYKDPSGGPNGFQVLTIGRQLRQLTSLTLQIPSAVSCESVRL